MYKENDFIPLSAVERYAFCPRQAYIFHAERQRGENRFTVEGSFIHRRVTEGGEEERGGVWIVRSLHIASRRLGVVGIADVVELREGRPLPVEYKRGGRTGSAFYHVQLCLQALCLEEMLGVEVPVGHIYHDATHQREVVDLDASLRAKTEQTVAEVRALLGRRAAPPARRRRHCEACSLVELCLPRVTDGRTSAAKWIAQCLEEDS